MAKKTTIALSEGAIKALENRYGPKFDQDKYMPGARVVSRKDVAATASLTDEGRVRKFREMQAMNGLSEARENIELTLLLHGSRDDYETAAAAQKETEGQRSFDEALYSRSGARIDGETGPNRPVDLAFADEVRRSNRDQAQIDTRQTSVVLGGSSDRARGRAIDKATAEANRRNAARADEPVAPFYDNMFSAQSIGQAFALRGYTPVMSDTFGRAVEFGLREGDRHMREAASRFRGALRPTQAVNPFVDSRILDSIRSRFSF